MLKRNENLFSESTMSFGEHLEELRICLWRAVLWLAGGFVVGLLFAGNVVSYIQVPLNQSLDKYYLDQGTKLLKKASKELSAEGYDAGWLMSIPKEKRFFPEIYYIFPGQLENQIDQRLIAVPEKAQEKHRPVDLIDNLNERKTTTETGKSADRKVEPEAATPVTVRLDEKPRPMVLFKKIESLSSTRSKALGVHEPFWIYIKAAFMVGIVAGSPGIFYSLWSFVAAGLYYKERKYVYIFMPFSIILFIAGVSLSFFFVFGYVLDFLFAFNAWMNIDPDTRITEWVNFAFFLPVGFGISFQLPLVIFVLERVGILPLEILITKWKISVLIIFLISMLLTPGDPQSMMLMAVPLTVLYFMGIGLCYVLPKKKSEFDSIEN